MGTIGLSVTLANSIIGVGILAMPFCFQQCGVLLATLILLLMGLVSRLCCYFLLKAALISRRRNFEFLAFHVFGPLGKMVVEIGIIGFLMGTCVAYFVVVGDLGPQIVAKMFNINQSDTLRTTIMVVVSLVCVLPLGLLRNVDSLSNVSAATIGFYFCLVIKVITEAATQLMSESWPGLQLWRPAGMLQCVPIFSMALFCQTQLFEISDSLSTFSLEKMNAVTKNAINICTAVYFTLGLFGYIAFSAQDISGNILMCLSPTMASDVIKLGFVMSLAFSFPLVILPCRASLYSFLYRKVHHSHHDHLINHSIPETTFRCLTAAIVALSLAGSLLLPNVELVLGFAGSTIGVLVCVVFPAASFVGITGKDTNERLLAKVILVLGLVIMVLGTYANLQAAENQIDKYDDKVITQERIDKIVEDFFEKRDKANDEIILKTVEKSDIIDHEELQKNGEEVKDSEVQPPNPIPPDSNEKPKETKNAQASIEAKKIETNLLQLERASESHPKNLQSKLNGVKLSNGEAKQDTIIEKVPEDKSEAPKEDKNQEKIDLMKQRKLIETIKQHGEEQKELIKEQKEILDELKKTKDELNKNKKVDSDEAKKIAVESIQKIANVAIQSLSGVTDKPGGLENDKIAHDAVQEITKKVVETIEAMKESNDKKQEPPEAPKHKENLVQNVPTSLNQEQKANIIPQAESQVANVNEIQNQQAVVQNINQIVPKPQESGIPVQSNVQQSNLNMNQAQKVDVVPMIVNNNLPKQPLPLLNQNIPPNVPINQNVVQQPIKNPHIHTQDEPQSYKEGEDVQKLVKNVAQNIPLPLAMNNKAISEEPKLINDIEKQQGNVQKNGPNIVQNEVNGRAKREATSHVPNLMNEVVDCTKKTTLRPEDKEICETLVNNPNYNENTKDILEKQDLNDLVALRSIPIEMIHHVRSLKRYDETKNR